MDDTSRPSCVVLASQSPRRRRLIEWLGLPVVTAAVDTPENLDTPLASDPAALARSLAAEKAVAARDEGLAADALVLTFDTIVVHAGRVLGKPVDEADAWAMLRSLSGRTHQVVTGFALLCPADEQPRTYAVTTNVLMRDLDDARIEEWMARGEYMGCAGAYNIEGQVAEVTADECFQNVAGLPLCHLYAAMLELPEECLPARPRSPLSACDAALGRHCGLACRVQPAED